MWMILLKSRSQLKVQVHQLIMLLKQQKLKEKKEGGFLGVMVLPMGASLIAPMASSLLQYMVFINKQNNQKRSHQSRKMARKSIFTVISITFSYESSARKSCKNRIGYNEMDQMDENFQSSYIVKSLARLLTISTTNLGLLVIFHETVHPD